MTLPRARASDPRCGWRWAGMPDADVSLTTATRSICCAPCPTGGAARRSRRRPTTSPRRTSAAAACRSTTTWPAQARVIDECVRVLRPGGSICWQVGNHVTRGRDRPARRRALPALQAACRSPAAQPRRLALRARPALHQAPLRSVRGDPLVHPGHGVPLPPRPDPRAAEVSRQARLEGSSAPASTPAIRCGKNPGDVWTFPNVKANHVEKTIHPCQFPIELVERFVLATHRAGRSRARSLHGRRHDGLCRGPARPPRRGRRDRARSTSRSHGSGLRWRQPGAWNASDGPARS